MVLPLTVLGFHQMASLMRYTRSSMIDVMQQDYIRTARAKGLSERVVVYRHALRNSLTQLVTMITLSMGGLVSGAVLVETVFTWPGMGTLIYSAIGQRDYNLITAGTLLISLTVLMANLLADILYAVVDPRVTIQVRGRNMALNRKKSKEKEESRSPMQIGMERFFKNKLAVLGLIVLSILILLSVLAPLLTPYDRDAVDLFNAFQPPNAEHILGTDDVGRDTFTRLLHGGRVSLSVGLVSASISILVGVCLGVMAGYFGGGSTWSSCSLVDIFMSLPF